MYVEMSQLHVQDGRGQHVKAPLLWPYHMTFQPKHR